MLHPWSFRTGAFLTLALRQLFTFVYFCVRACARARVYTCPLELKDARINGSTAHFLLSYDLLSSDCAANV